MPRLVDLNSVSLILTRRLLLSSFAGRSRRLAHRQQANRRRRWGCLNLEVLEDRTLLSATILGNVFNDLNGDGLRQSAEPGLAGQVVYLGPYNGGQPGSMVTTVPNSPPSGQTSLNLNNLGGGYFDSQLSVANVPQTVQDVAVTLDLTNDSLAPVPVVLLSPTGISGLLGTGSIAQGPYLFSMPAATQLPDGTIQPYQFVGTFDGNSTNFVNQAPNPVPSGTYAPQMAFNNPQVFIENEDPNGVWGLLFISSSATNPGVTLNSWSLTLTQPEPSTTTNAAGNYSFTDVPAGPVSVNLVVPSGDAATSPGGATQTMMAVDGQTINGVNFGLKALPDLAGTSFSVVSPATAWGQTITIDYTLTNQGAGDAPAFDADLQLATASELSAAGPLQGIVLSGLSASGPLQGAVLSGSTLQFDPLAAGASDSGTVLVKLPAQPPAGFDSLSTTYVALDIDPSNAVAETDKANNSKQGAGIDLALVGAPVNTDVSAAPGVQQAPSIAVDPTNPNHLVTAYMDYSAPTVTTTAQNAGAAAGPATVTPLVMLGGIFVGANLAIDAGQPDAETVTVTAVTATTFTATFSLSHPAGFTIATGYAGIGIAVSKDGGATWTTSSIPLPAGFSQGAAAPTVAFDAKGNVYVSFMAATFLGEQPVLTNPDSDQRAFGFQSNNGIFVAESTTGGLTWNQPSAVVENLYTGSDVQFDCYPAMAVDTLASSPYLGSIYVTWSRFYPAGQFPGDPGSTGGSDVMFAVSNTSNGGSLWKPQMQDLVSPITNSPVRVSAIHDPNAGFNDQTPSGSGYIGFSSVTVGAGGAVFVSADLGGYFTVYSSRNGGLSVSTSGGLVSGFTSPNFTNYLGNPFNYTTTQIDTDGTLDNFRTINTREIAADPTRPGVVYAVAASSLDQLTLNNAAAANGIVFAVSYDYGQSWTTDFTVGSEASIVAQLTPAQLNAGYFPVLNDDNGGQYPGFASSLQSQVVSHQVLPNISVNANGDITVIWYDTRTDPQGQDLTVWGTVSTDGGQHFSANFQVTNTSFNPGAGAFTGGNGTATDYIGDQLGVATASGAAYAVWTDTRNGNQDVYFGSYSLTPAPQPPADRFGPNNTLQTATDLGKVTVQQEIPNLTLPPGASDEWFSFQAGASDVSISVSAAVGGGNLELTLTDANGNVIPNVTITDVLDSNGAIIGKALVASGDSGAIYKVHVSAQSDSAINYALTLGSLTEDLGTQVEGTLSDTVAAGGENIYRLAAAVAGTLQIDLTGTALQGSGLSLTILGADGQTVLAASPTPAAITINDAPAEFRLPVTQGEVMLIEVAAVDAASSGSFTLQFTNLDEYQNNLTQVEGSISDSRSVPASVLANQDYAVTAPADGTPLQLTFSASGGYAGTLKVRVLNSDETALVAGNQLVASGGSAEFDLSSVAPGQTVFVRVSGVGLNPGDTADYTIQGTQVEGTISDSRTVPLPALPNQDYTVTASLNGTLEVTLNASGGYSGLLKVRILNSDETVLVAGNQYVASGGSIQLTVPSVTAGETVYVRVSGVGLAGGDEADYTMDVINLAYASTLFFPTIGDPTSIAAVDLGNGTTDLLVSNTDATDSLGVLLGNGNGTFTAESQYAIDPGLVAPGQPAGNRQIAVADFNGDGIPDVMVPNYRAADVSVLLGNGDGTFQPQRQFDAVTNDDSIATGDFNGDDKNDAIVLENFNQGAPAQFAVLLGNGNGAFTPFGLYTTVFTDGAGPIVVGDFTGDGNQDVIIFSKNSAEAELFKGNGDGTFQAGIVFATPENIFNAVAVDLNGDGKLDLVMTGTNSGDAYVLLGNGNGTFQPAQAFQAMAGANVGLPGLAVVDFNTGHLDIVVTAQSRSEQGAAEVVMLPGLVDSNGNYAGFGAPVVLANVSSAGQIAVGDFTGSGTTDLAVAVEGGVTVIYGAPLNLNPITTPATALNLGDTPHLITLPQAVVPDHQDAYFTYTVPTEAVADAGNEVVDIWAMFQDTTGAGLTLDVTGGIQEFSYSDSTGERVRVVAAQGSKLTIHVESNAGGYGVYTLDVDVLPQMVSAQAEAPLPGGPLTSVVLTFQGDRLDPTEAEDANNYIVTYLGATGNQILVPISASYDDSADLQVVSGLTYPTAARQTVTLLFAVPLVPGSYQIQLSPDIQTVANSAIETSMAFLDDPLDGHPVVQVSSAASLKSFAVAHVAGASAGGGGSSLMISNGSTFATTLTRPSDPSTIQHGTLFLTQLQNDLGAQLNDLLSEEGDNSNIAALVNAAILLRFAPLLSADPTDLAVFWLDPVSLDLLAPQQQQVSYDLQKTQNAVTNNSSQTYIDVGGNVELIVVAGLAGTYKLDVSDVPAEARGGVVLLSTDSDSALSFTDGLRSGISEFVVAIDASSSIVSPGGNGPGGDGSNSSGGATAGLSAGLGQNAALALVATLLNSPPLELELGEFEPGTTASAGVNAAFGYNGANGLSSSNGNVGPDNAANLMNPLFFGQSLRTVADDVFRLWQEASDQLISSWQTWGGPPLGVLNLAASQPWRELEAMGLKGMPGIDQGGQALFNALLRFRAEAAEALGKGSPAPSTPAPPGGTAADPNDDLDELLLQDLSLPAAPVSTTTKPGESGDALPEGGGDGEVTSRDDVFCDVLLGQALQEKTEENWAALLLVLGVVQTESQTASAVERNPRRKPCNPSPHLPARSGMGE